MILYKETNDKNSKKLYEYAIDKYSNLVTARVGKDLYNIFSNGVIDHDPTDICFGELISVAPWFMSDEVKEQIFNSDIFQRCHDTKNKLFTSYSDHDYISFIGRMSTDEFDDILTYALMNYIFDENDDYLNSICIQRSNFIPLFSNKNKTIYSTIAIDEFNTTFKVNKNKIEIAVS